jgi:hypothetical protein
LLERLELPLGIVKARAKAGYLRAVSVLDVDTVSSGALPLL